MENIKAMMKKYVKNEKAMEVLQVALIIIVVAIVAVALIALGPRIAAAIEGGTGWLGGG